MISSVCWSGVVDTNAHRGAPAIEGRWLAGLVSGLERVYREENRRLATEIAECGVVGSDFPAGAPPRAVPRSPARLLVS